MSVETSAFEFAKRVTGVQTLPELDDLFREYVEPMGVTFYMCGQVVMPGGEVKTTRLFGTFDNAWFKHYESNYLFMDDPAVRLLKSISYPYSWSMLKEQFGFSQGEQFVMDEARRLGLSEGIVFPLHGARSSLAGASAAGKNLRTGRTDILALQLIMEQAYRQAISITGLFEEDVPAQITKRQRECLNWAQHGKSNVEIAVILGISSHTVKDHIDAAKRAFGVSTRVEAVVCAGNANLIGISPLSDIEKRRVDE